MQELLDAVSTLVNGKNIFCSCSENTLSKHIKIFETVQKSNGKTVPQEAPECDY